MIEGRALRLGDNVTTDDIIAGKYKHQTIDDAELAAHLMENIDPEFAANVRPGDLIVAGRNFGCGSSREQAPRIIKQVGIAAVLAESFARIFFRNSINIGLLLVQCDTRAIEHGDRVRYDSARGVVEVPERSLQLETPPLPGAIADIVRAGGLLAHVAAKGDL